ncbi:MAG: sigma-70 family RNA polymerase sigma factor [Chloroflexota bacterium]|jgi:RNA polymerase sigma factor (sigma-70 family)
MTDFSQSSDEELISACRSGDDFAWDALVERYQRLVYTIPSRYGLTPAEIDDVFQSTWLSLLRNLETLREPDRVSAWLVTTARRECWERRRGSDYERSVSTDLDTVLRDKETDELTPEEIVGQFRDYQVLQDAIGRLGQRCQNLLRMLYFDASAPTYADVAENLDTPIGSIGPMRARCLKKLRGLLMGKVHRD